MPDEWSRDACLTTHRTPKPTNVRSWATLPRRVVHDGINLDLDEVCGIY